MRTLIKDGTVVTASDTFAADVWIENGKIAALVQPGTNLGEADQTIDAKGSYVIPGGIDAHTHMELPFGGTTASDDFDTGTVAAAHGGTTTIVDFAIQSKGSSMRAGLDAWHAKAEGKAAIDYGFHMIMTEANPSTLEEMSGMIREGVTSVKMFMAYPGVFLVDDQQIFRKGFSDTGLSHSQDGQAIRGLQAQIIIYFYFITYLQALSSSQRCSHGNHILVPWAVWHRD